MYDMIAQKYIENPLKFKSRKMDLRLWVLATNPEGFEPMKIWLYDEFWIRLAMHEYEDDDETLDFKKHLTNASIARIALAKQGGDYIRNLQEYVKGSGDFVDEFGQEIWD